MKPKVSVIIPAYNSEKQLKRCLDSVFQSEMINSIEVILVNDGSTDDTLSVARRYLAHSNFKLIDKANQGVAIARYVGFHCCKGDYISFVDSDDYINPSMYAKLYKTAHETGAEIVVCSVFRVEKGKVSLWYDYPESISENPKDAIKRVVINNINGQLWNKLFHWSVFKESHFSMTRGITCCEDMLILYHALLGAKTVSYVSDPFYYYVVHPDSTVQNPSIYTIRDFYYVKTKLVQEFLCSDVDSWKELAQLYYARGLPWALRQLNKMPQTPMVKELKSEITYKIKNIKTSEVSKFNYNRLALDLVLVKLGLFRLYYCIAESRVVLTIMKLFSR